MLLFLPGECSVPLEATEVEVRVCACVPVQGHLHFGGRDRKSETGWEQGHGHGARFLVKVQYVSEN